jgi:hypothetical protein
MKLKYVLALLVCCQVARAQQDSSSLLFSGYAEAYYSYAGTVGDSRVKPDFYYNHKRQNQVGLNLLYLKASFSKGGFRSNLAAMVGDYSKYNLSAEPQWAKPIYEANVGVRVSKKNNIWIDAGVLPSHIGFESAVGADCWTLTRSMLAENSPYYETGIKASYLSKNEKFTAAFLVLNGWQKIATPAFIHQPSYGIQLNYKATPALILNYSNFLGREKPDSFHAVRFFHNIYAIYTPGKHWGITAGLDIGSDKYTVKNRGTWWSPVVMVRYAASPKFRMAMRWEYYRDRHQIMIPAKTADGFKISGLSMNADYQISSHWVLRFELKHLKSNDPVFSTNNAWGDKQNLSFNTCLSFKF